MNARRWQFYIRALKISHISLDIQSSMTSRTKNRTASLTGFIKARRLSSPDDGREENFSKYQTEKKRKNKRLKVNKRKKDFLDFLGLLPDSRSIIALPAPLLSPLPSISLSLSLGQFIEHTSGMRGLLTLDRAWQPNGQPRCIAGGT